MKTNLLNLLDKIQSSFWFVPTICALVATFLSVALPLLDLRIDMKGIDLPFWIRTDSDIALATLSSIAGAMVGVTGTVFSITIVILSLTSQQFGPRLLRRFMHDLPTQLTLGIFLSTGFYCLLVLRVVGNFSSVASKPHFSVLGAILLTTISMGMLILFVHHVAVSIQAPNIVAAVARDLDDSIKRLFPDENQGPGMPSAANEKDDSFQLADLGEKAGSVAAKPDGYIQAIDVEKLMEIASERDLLVRLHSHPGNFVAAGTALADIWTYHDKKLTESDLATLTEEFNDAYIVGNRRTPRQDLECAIEELTEVAIRSLSPGINDPFTAFNCIDRLGASLGRIVTKKKRSRLLRCKDVVRVIVRDSDFSDALNAAFNQIRQYSRGNVGVTIRLLEGLASIAENIMTEEDGLAVQKHADMIMQSTQTIPESFDKSDIQKRFDDLMTMIAKKRRSSNESDVS